MKASYLTLLLSLFPAALVAASAPEIPPGGIPGGSHSTTFVITQPGSYYLMGDRTMTDTSLNAIEIASSDVTLDLRGHTLRYPSIVAGGGTAIHGKNVHNVEVRNGAVSVIPGTGISLYHLLPEGLSNIRVIDMRVSAVGHMGIYVQANSALVDRCTVDHTGNTAILISKGSSAVVSNCTVSYSQTYGIEARSVGITIRNTSVQNVTAAGIVLVRGTVVDSQVIACNKGKYPGCAGILLQDSFNVVKNTVVASCYLKGIQAAYGRSVLENNVVAGTLTVSDTVGGEAIFAAAGANVLAINNRYSTGTILTANVTSVGNTAF